MWIPIAKNKALLGATALAAAAMLAGAGAYAQEGHSSSPNTVPDSTTAKVPTPLS